jgi:threonine dehydratase
MHNPESRLPTPEGIARAAAKLALLLPATPLLEADLNGSPVWLKAENLQPIGSFKIRGAWHRMSDLTEAERAAGVVGVSSGNHAQGVAWAAQKLRITAAIVMPNDAPQVKIDATRNYGAEVVLYDRPGGEDRDAVAARLIEQRGATLVHAFADPWVIEGQGSMGLEIVAEMTRRSGTGPTRIICPCGGGGMTAGLALACPDAEIVPVEPEGWDDVCRSLAAGEILTVGKHAPPTACDALQTPGTRPINFAILQRRVPFGLFVTPAEVRAAQRYAFQNLHLVLEPGGAAALAAAMAGKVALDGRTAIVLSGGNTDPASFAGVISGDD